MAAQVYIGTILLEMNRWPRGKQPTYRVSEWAGRFVDAGFDGMELWENHAALADDDEVAALREGPCPVAIYNTYAPFTADGRHERGNAALVADALRANGIKYNIGNDPARRDEYLCAIRELASELPRGCRILCECHPGTLMEDPRVAASMLADLGEPRFQAMFHAFAVSHARLREWMALVGPRTTHIHVQMRDDAETFLCLDENADFAHEVLRILDGEGFAGSFTLEFTKGTRTADENIDDLFEAALRDLAFLRGAAR